MLRGTCVVIGGGFYVGDIGETSLHRINIFISSFQHAVKGIILVLRLQEVA